MDCITYKPLLYWIWSLVTFCISIIYSVNSTAFPFLNIRNELFMLLIFCSIISSKSEFYQKLWFCKKKNFSTTVIAGIKNRNKINLEIKLFLKHHYWIGNKNWLGNIIIYLNLQLGNINIQKSCFQIYSHFSKWIFCFQVNNVSN